MISRRAALALFVVAVLPLWGLAAMLFLGVPGSRAQVPGMADGNLTFPVQGFGPSGEFQGTVWALGGLAAVGANNTGVGTTTPLQPPQVLGNDLVIGVSDYSVPQAGPNIQGIVLRARRSLKNPITGCRLTVAAGNAFGKEVTIVDPIPAGSIGCPNSP